MIKLNKFEAIGFAVSIAVMSMALFAMRFSDSLGLDRGNLSLQGQSASIIMADGVNGASAALSQGMSGSKVTKLVATDVTIGKGAEVKRGDKVQIDYIATLQNGQEFDNTKKTGESFTFKVGDNKVIKGINEGIVGMKVGGQRILVIPADMAYGKDGYGPIPANATLVYAIELVGIE